MSKLDTYQDSVGQHRFRVVAANGEIIHASNRGFDTPGELALRLLEIQASLASHVVHYSVSGKGNHRWEIRESKIYCHENFERLSGCKHNYTIVREAFEAMELPSKI